MQKKNIASIGFMDPTKVNEFEVMYQPDTTIATIYRTCLSFMTRISYYYLTVASMCNCHLIVFANYI
jgi:hypothetical protein